MKIFFVFFIFLSLITAFYEKSITATIIEREMDYGSMDKEVWSDLLFLGRLQNIKQWLILVFGLIFAIYSKLMSSDKNHEV